MRSFNNAIANVNTLVSFNSNVNVIVDVQGAELRACDLHDEMRGDLHLERLERTGTLSTRPAHASAPTGVKCTWLPCLTTQPRLQPQLQFAGAAYAGMGAGAPDMGTGSQITGKARISSLRGSRRLFEVLPSIA